MVESFFLASEQELTPHEVLRILQRESDDRQRRTRVARGLLTGIVVFVVAVTVLGIALGKDMGGIFGLFGLSGLIGITAASSGRHKMAARAAARLGDKRAFGPLVLLLSSEDPSIKKVAEEAVTALLPEIDELDYRALDADQQGALVKSLQSTKDLNLAVGILGLANRAGGVEMIGPLEQFCSARSPLKKNDKERAISLAKMALAEIRMRKARQKIDARVQELGGTLPEYASKVLGTEDETQGLTA